MHDVGVHMPWHTNGSLGKTFWSQPHLCGFWGPNSDCQACMANVFYLLSHLTANISSAKYTLPNTCVFGPILNTTWAHISELIWIPCIMGSTKLCCFGSGYYNPQANRLFRWWEIDSWRLWSLKNRAFSSEFYDYPVLCLGEMPQAWCREPKTWQSTVGPLMYRSHSQEWCLTSATKQLGLYLINWYL